MSALLSKADIPGGKRDVRQVPIADIRQAICANKTYRFGAVSLNQVNSAYATLWMPH
jgi:hypothetical protein